MPKQIEELLELLDLEEIEYGLYRGHQPVTQRERVFGGQVLAQSLMAAMRTVEDDRQVHSMHAYFLRPGRIDRPMIYDVKPMRDGSSFSSRRVSVRQAGKHIFGLTASFQAGELGLDHFDPTPPGPDPEDCPKVSEVLAKRSGTTQSEWDDEWGALDLRFVGDSGIDGTIPTRSHRGHSRIYVRSAGELPDDPRVHAAFLAYASDLSLLGVSTVPHKIHFGPDNSSSGGALAASIDHALWFHRPVRADRWWLYDQTTPSASNARGFSLGRVFQDGALVATAAQEGLIRVNQ